MKKKEVVRLLKEVFWQLEDLEVGCFTSRFVRAFMAKNVQTEILETLLIGASGSCFWGRVEKAIWLHLNSKA